MNESEFKKRWNSEKKIYEAWGNYVASLITQELRRQEIDISTFIKMSATPRLKDDMSLIDKAFYRPGKNYTDPYNQIEDKVGVRFVVLLLEDIKIICDIIESSDAWEFDACKHFNEDKEREPLLFTYQSVHYILRPKVEIQNNDIAIPTSIPCELQIRTLLQHAHAELTHDAIYKAKKAVKPAVHRTVAKSMALIETTDDFFSEVTQELNRGPLDEYSIIDGLDNIYQSSTGLTPHNLKSSLAIWDAFEFIVDSQLIDNIKQFVRENNYISSLIQHKIAKNTLYQQSIVLFIFWLIMNKKQQLIENWPIERKILTSLATDLGVSIWDGD